MLILETCSPRRVSYDSQASLFCQLGQRLIESRTETTDAPTYNITAQPGYPVQTTTYSFFMIDPDVPNPDAGAARMTYLHWYVSGNKASCVVNQNTRETVTSYQSPSPGSTQQHRYTFLAYREPPGYQPEPLTTQDRPGFDVNAYAANGGLVLVGGNFFLEAITNT